MSRVSECDEALGRGIRLRRNAVGGAARFDSQLTPSPARLSCLTGVCARGRLAALEASSFLLAARAIPSAFRRLSAAMSSDLPRERRRHLGNPAPPQTGRGLGLSASTAMATTACLSRERIQRRQRRATAQGRGFAGVGFGSAGAEGRPGSRSRYCTSQKIP